MNSITENAPRYMTEAITRKFETLGYTHSKALDFTLDILHEVNERLEQDVEVQNVCYEDNAN